MKTSQHIAGLNFTDWSVSEPRFDAGQMSARETIFTIGNRYLGTRGSFEEGYPQAMPATLINGIYDNVPVTYTELANCPDWLSLVFFINGERFRLDRGEILQYKRHLDVRYGLLNRHIRWRSPAGKTLEFHFERFASLANQHVLALRCQITPIDCSGSLTDPYPWKVEIQSSLNGYPENNGFNHWEQLGQGKIEQDSEHGIWLQLCTRTSHVELGMVAKFDVIGADAKFDVASPAGDPTMMMTYMAAEGQTICVEKLVTVFTSQEAKQPAQAAINQSKNQVSYAQLLKAHQLIWDGLWEYSDIAIEGDLTAQLAVRYNLFQLLISASSCNDHVSIPAKTLSGFGYRGHVFWDTEIFILPFFTYTQPAIARSLLTYRYHCLEGARRKAAHRGYQGAMFSWESAATGDEVAPQSSMPTDPYAESVRIWCRDREIHLSADIAYAVWQYWQATGDDHWLCEYGAEIILDSARFWMSRLEWHPKYARYELCGVIGPDEYHEKVPNNAFTNRMVQWHLETAVAVQEWLMRTYPEKAKTLEQRLGLTPAQSLNWQTAITQIYIPYSSKSKLIEQFEGFFQLKDIDLAEYEPRSRSMQAILGMDETNKRQVLKQPDVLMLLYLMRRAQAAPYSLDVLRKNWDYYAPRTDTTYGSSLTSAIHAIVAANLGAPAEAYQQFMQAAMVDLDDTRGNTADGIHAASAGGVWQAVVFGFGGIQLKGNGPVASPQLPASWTRLQFKLQWHGRLFSFDLRPSHSHTAKIEGFIFDLDGVLTDTAELHYQAWKQLASEEGLIFDRKANEKLRGVSRRASLMLIIGNKPYSEERLQAMMDQKNCYYVELLQAITKDDILPGALNLLAEIRQAGLKIAIASASGNANMVIDKLDLAKSVDAIADGNSVKQQKPAPDIFLFAATQLGLAPAHCVVVEDAPAGVAAAIAAGMRSIGIGDPYRIGTANIVLPNLEDAHLGELLTKLNEQACTATL